MNKAWNKQLPLYLIDIVCEVNCVYTVHQSIGELTYFFYVLRFKKYKLHCIIRRHTLSVIYAFLSVK